MKKILRPTIKTEAKSPKTYTVYSPEYADKRTILCKVVWYDVYPFCLSLWPGTYQEKVFRGWWWCKRIKDIGITIEMLAEGEIVYESEGNTLTLSPREVFLQPPGVDVLCRNGRFTRTHHFQLTLYGGIVSFFQGWFGIRNPCIIRFEDPKESSGILKTMKQIARLLKEKNPEKASEIYILCNSLLAKLTAAYKRNNSDVFSGVLTNALMRMEANLDNKITVTEMAKHLHVSRMTLLRLFHKYFQMSPKDYLLKLRMEKAQKLLLDPQNRINEVSALLGYKNPLYFSMAFRKYTGLSPRNFRTK